jgi:hypothetical protein
VRISGASDPSVGDHSASAAPSRYCGRPRGHCSHPCQGLFVEVSPPASSLSLRIRTRCLHASAILWSCSWIRSVKPSDVFRCCADHVSMLCSRNCVRLQRGSVVSFGSSAECEPLKPLIQPLQAGCSRRGAMRGQRRPVVAPAVFGPVYRGPMP